MAYIGNTNSILVNKQISKQFESNVLPNIASKSSFGIVRIGENINVTPDGIISVDNSSIIQSEPVITGLVIPVTIVTSCFYYILSSDYYIGVNADDPTTIVLPAGKGASKKNTNIITVPSISLGTVYIIKDISGRASINPITVKDTSTIDGSEHVFINTDYGCLTLIYNGVEWNII